MSVVKVKDAKVSQKVSASPKDVSKASAVFKMVGDPIRLNLLLTIAEGECAVGELCADLGQSQPTISHPLALLRLGGFIQHRRLGKKNLYSVTDRGRQLVGQLRKIIPLNHASKPQRIETKAIDPALLDDVSGFVDDAEGWFPRPNAEFEGRSPVDLLGTSEEQRLRNRIEAAKFGMFS